MQLTKTTFFLGCLVGGLGAALVPLLFSSLHAENQLLPFQGRLTDPSGTALADGTKVVEFKIYDAPTGGSVKWSGEVHKLSINGGLVNTMLGSKASLSSVDFSTPCYLQITVDANSDNQITLADPPLLPRQSVVPAIYASEAGNSRNSQKLAGADWSALMVNSGGTAVNDPTSGYLNGAKIQPASITTTQLQNAGVKTAQIDDSAVTSAKIADGAVLTIDLADNAVTSSKIPDASILASKLTPRNMVSANGGIYKQGLVRDVWSDINLSTTITTTGRPVMVCVQPQEGKALFITAEGYNQSPNYCSFVLRLQRAASSLGEWAVTSGWGNATSAVTTVGLSLVYVDNPPAGTHVYKYQMLGRDGSIFSFDGAKVVAIEL